MLNISKLTVAYGDSPPVLEQVSLKVRRGEFVSLVGPSGCGKSTLLRVVMGLQKASSGMIHVEVAPRDIGFLFQDDALLPWRSARENVALGLRARGTPGKEALDSADHWLQSVGLAGLGGRYPRELSGGQRKRVAIAQVLALRPQLLLMDEPFASLDAIMRHYITEDLLKWVEDEDLTVLMVTHDLGEAVVVSDQVTLLGNGPRAHVKGSFEVPLARPRDLIAAREQPACIALTHRLWAALAQEIDAPREAHRTEARAV